MHADIDSYRWNDNFGGLHSSSYMKILGSSFSGGCKCYTYYPVHHYSLDGGLSWHTLTTPGGYIWKVLPLEHSVNSLLSIGLAGGRHDIYDGFIAKSDDGGATWHSLNSGIVDDVIAADLISERFGNDLNVTNLVKSQCDAHRNWISFTMPSAEEDEWGRSMEHVVLSYTDDVGDTWNIAHQAAAELAPAKSVYEVTESCLSGHVYFLRVLQKSGLAEIELASGKSKYYFEDTPVEYIEVNKKSGSVYAIVEGELKRKNLNSDAFNTISHGIRGVQRYVVDEDDDFRIIVTDELNGLHYTIDGREHWVKLSGDFEALKILTGSEGFLPIEPYFIAGKEASVLLKVRAFVGDWVSRTGYSKGLYYSLED